MSGRLKRHEYPPHWPELRALALTRDALCCACQGECGDPHPPPGRCGAPHQAAIVRDPAAALAPRRLALAGLALLLL